MSRALQAGCIWLSSTNWRLLVLASFLLASKFEACHSPQCPPRHCLHLPDSHLPRCPMMRAWQDDTPLDLQDLAMFALATSANTSRRASSDAVSSDAAGVIRPGSHQMRRRQQKGAPRRKSIDILPNLYSGVGEEAPPAGRFMARNGERHPLRRSPKLQPLVEAQYRRAEVRLVAQPESPLRPPTRRTLTACPILSPHRCLCSSCWVGTSISKRTSSSGREVISPGWPRRWHRVAMACQPLLSAHRLTLHPHTPSPEFVIQPHRPIATPPDPTGDGHAPLGRPRLPPVASALFDPRIRHQRGGNDRRSW